MVDAWLKAQGVPKEDIVNPDATNLADQISGVARHFSLRLSLYQAVWELVSSCDLVPVSVGSLWSVNVTSQSRRGSGSFLSDQVSYPRLERIQRPIKVSTISSDPDIFLQGIDCKSLHSGIREAIERDVVIVLSVFFHARRSCTTSPANTPPMARTTGFHAFSSMVVRTGNAEVAPPINGVSMA